MLTVTSIEPLFSDSNPRLLHADPGVVIFKLGVGSGSSTASANNVHGRKDSGAKESKPIHSKVKGWSV